MVYGGHKWRDGVHKHYNGNMYVTPADAGTNDKGVGWYVKNTADSTFVNNTLISWKAAPQFHYAWSNPSPLCDFNISNNKYYTPGQSSLPFRVDGATSMQQPGVCEGAHANPKPSDIRTLADWQAMTGNGKGSTISTDIDVDGAIALAKWMLGV